MGGMAAQIPVKGDPAANEAAFAKVRADKEREATRRPRRHLGRPSRSRAGREGSVRPADAAAEPARQACARTSHVTPRRPARGARGHSAPRRACARTSASACNISRPGCAGRGAVPLYNLMEDAATAEISRAQIWQWIHLQGEARRRPRGDAATVPRALMADEMEQGASGARRQGLRRRPLRRGDRALRRHVARRRRSRSS